MEAETVEETLLALVEGHGRRDGRGRGQWARMLLMAAGGEADQIWTVKEEERHHQRRHELRRKRGLYHPTSQITFPGPPLRVCRKPEVV